MEEITSPPAHTCAHCVDIVFPGSPEKIHTSRDCSPEYPLGNLDWLEKTVHCLGLSLADLRLKANAGCDLSQYLKDEIEHKMYRDEDPGAVQLYVRTAKQGNIITIEPRIGLQDPHLPYDVFGGKDVSRGLVTAGYEIYCHLSNTSGNMSYEGTMMRKSIAHDPLSARTVTSVRGWLKHCEDERHGYHKICSLSERAYVPTRLIKISGLSDQLQLRIVCGDDMGEHHMSGYVALSYCWGGDQTNKLTQENHDLYKKNIAWKTLPKTIRDAARTAQALGFQYIWIDSMCIVQDSKKDKEAEINQMTKVYAHATLTIVNKRGERVTEGFLHPRKLPSGTSIIQYRAKDGQIQRLNLSFDRVIDLEESSAINTRGWTLQEYLLSRRRLVIGTWSTEWHCRREVDNHRDGWMPSSRGDTDTSAGIPSDYEGRGWAGHRPFESEQAESVRNSSFINAAMFFSVNPGCSLRQLDEQIVHRSWIAIVDSYSSRSVTESEDRILALSGIAERFADLLPGRYIAGMWENMMPASLFWEKVDSRTDRPVKYRGPSWSWMSIDGQVALHLDSDYMCEVLSIEYMLKSAEALYGAVHSAALHIKGPAFSVEWRYTRQDRQQQGYKQLQEDLSELRWFRDGSDVPLDSQLKVYLDAREQTTEWREVILLAGELREYDYTYCIALSKVDQVEVDNEPRNRFRRLGLGYFEDTSPLPHAKGWPVNSYYVI